MTDAEYDALKQSLAGSSVYTLPREGPVCTLGKPGVRGQKQVGAVDAMDLLCNTPGAAWQRRRSRAAAAAAAAAGSESKAAAGCGMAAELLAKLTWRCMHCPCGSSVRAGRGADRLCEDAAADRAARADCEWG